MGLKKYPYQSRERRQTQEHQRSQRVKSSATARLSTAQNRREILLSDRQDQAREEVEKALRMAVSEAPSFIFKTAIYIYQKYLMLICGSVSDSSFKRLEICQVFYRAKNYLISVCNPY